jgi:hypothetical protein
MTRSLAVGFIAISCLGAAAASQVAAPAPVTPAEPATLMGAAPASVPVAEPATITPAEPATVTGAAPASVSTAEPATITPAAPATVSAPQPASEPTSLPAIATVEKCGVVHELAQGSTATMLLPSIHVMGLGDESSFSLPPDAPAKVRAVQCARDVIVPQRNDYKVLAAGFPFAIISGDRVGVIEGLGRKLSFRMIKGYTTPAEQAAVDEAMKAAQIAFEKSLSAKKLVQ